MQWISGRVSCQIEPNTIHASDNTCIYVYDTKSEFEGFSYNSLNVLILNIKL